MKIRIGVLGTADIAKRKMIPAILQSEKFEYAGVAIASFEERGENPDEEEREHIWNNKCKRAYDFQREFGGSVFKSFEDLLQSKDIDAVYIPLPPALHYKWADKALECGKHILMEKPFTCSADDTAKLITKAQNKALVVWENYAFVYHNQVDVVKEALHEIGDIRLIRAAFGFPHRQESDFRYQKSAGGGALLDCGGYTVKAATLFMRGNLSVETSQLQITPGHEVDVYGSATLKDEENVIAQLAFGMDNAYICELQIWGSTGIITAPRFFTAPAEMDAQVTVKVGNEEKQYAAKSDQFLNSLEAFGQEICMLHGNRMCYQQISSLANLIEKFCKVTSE